MQRDRVCAVGDEVMTPPDIWIVVVIVGLIIAGTAQVLINHVVIKRFAIDEDRLKWLEDEVFGDMTVISGPDIEEKK